MTRAAARRTRVVLFLAVAAFGHAGTAQADWLLTPFVGSTFGAQTTYLTFDPEVISKNRAVFGGSGAWLSDGILGVEGELAFIPGLFDDDFTGLRLLTNSSVVTLFGNAIAAVPLGVTRESLRPFAVAGLGLVAVNGQDVVGLFESDRALGLQLGGGALGFVTDRVGLRFDLRYTRTVRRAEALTGERETKLSFWRAGVGVTLRY